MQLRSDIAKQQARGYRGNMVGEGLVTGGVYVVRSGGVVQWSFLEPEIGQNAVADVVVRRAKEAAVTRLVAE